MRGEVLWWEYLSPLANDLLCIKPGSRLTYFTSLLFFRPSELVHVRDSAQDNGLVFLGACLHSWRELYRSDDVLTNEQCTGIDEKVIT
jgi:hypothetical protein